MSPFDEARSRATLEARANIDLIEAFFQTLEAMDFEATGRFFTDDGVYCDEPAHEMDATGPAGVTEDDALVLLERARREDHDSSRRNSWTLSIARRLSTCDFAM